MFYRLMRTLGAALLLALFAGQGLAADVKISDLPAATDLSGATVPIVQSATTKKAAIALFDARFQAADSDLTTWSGLTPSANAQSLVTAADYAAMRSLLSLVPGTNVEAWDADLDAISALTPTNDDVLQRKAGAWINRSIAQLKTDLSLSGSNTGDQSSVTGNAGTATKLATPRNIDGQPFDGSADITVIAPGTHAATSKTTPVDADELPIVDSAASNVLKKLTWANLKATAKTYFDTLYQPLVSALTSWGSVTRASGFDTFVATPSCANLRALLTDESGTGTCYFAGGNAGTPSGIDLSNATNVPVANATGTLAVSHGGTGGTTQNAAALGLGGCYVLDQSAVGWSVTGTTSETVLKTVTIPANAIGANGFVTEESVWTVTNDANNKTPKVRYGASGSGTGGTALWTAAFTTTQTLHDLRKFANRNATNSQVAFTGNANAGNGGWGAATVAAVTTSVDTTAASEINFTGTLANTGDTMTLEAYQITVCPHS